MEEFNFDKSILVATIGSENGAQPKYNSNGRWFKQDNCGYEGYSEYLVSKILEFSNVDNFVKYSRCIINGKNGCVSDDFNHDNEVFLSFQKMFDMYYGGEFEGKLSTMDSPEERIDFTKSFVFEQTGLDISDYLSSILSLDMLTLNPDRHMNNLGVIANIKSHTFRIAPIFDNGASLCSDLNRFPPYMSIDELRENVIGRPFSSNLELQALAAGISLKIDYDKAFEFLDSENTDIRAKKILIKQLDKYASLLKMNYEELLDSCNEESVPHRRKGR